jgi:hypothetical protein
MHCVALDSSRAELECGSAELSAYLPELRALAQNDPQASTLLEQIQQLL